jgi:hypothetical protein
MGVIYERHRWDLLSCHDIVTCLHDYRQAFYLVNRFIDHLYIELGFKSNYSVIANLHTAVPWQRLLTVEILEVPSSQPLMQS